MNTGAKVGNKRFMTLLSLLKKTLKRGLKFQEERYLSSHTVYTKVFSNSFMVKAKCRASMSTREIHDLEVSLDLTAITADTVIIYSVFFSNSPVTPWKS